MMHVIVERPRIGSKMRGTPSKGCKKKINLEESPVREGMTRLYEYRKELNEHLSPLLRFLHSKCGQPWNDVFSEICKNIRQTNAVQKHVRDHIDKMVEKKVLIINGEVRDSKGERIYVGKFFKVFYVCPLTGLLKEMPKTNWPQRPQKPGHIFVLGKAIKQVVVDKLTRYLKLDGLWFLVTFKKMPKTMSEEYVGIIRKKWPMDIVLKMPAVVSAWKKSSDTWHDDIYAVSKKQIGKREIRDVEKKWQDSIKE